MNDRAVSLLEHYDIEVMRTRKGRGAILCETGRGLLIFKEYSGNPERLKVQDLLLKTIAEKGLVQAESLIPNKEGELFTKDKDGVNYILKEYRDARECNIREKAECLEAIRILAGLHLSTQAGLPLEMSKALSVGNEYEKKNRELKKIRKFLKARSQKTWFEISLLGCFDTFYDQAREAQEGWAAYQHVAGEQKAFCHGDYQYHNLLVDDRGWYLINFERCVQDDPVRDLHLILRKLLEKSNWCVELGEELLAAYERVRPLSAISRIDLYYRLAYPDKFWKIANFYYNSGKAWIPGRNQEKLEKLLAQETEKKKFLESAFKL